MKFSLEAVFHRKLKSLNVTKGQQGYIMGAFRDACKELGVDYDSEPEGAQDVNLAIAKALSELKCIHGSPVNESCDYCAALELLRVKP